MTSPIRKAVSRAIRQLGFRRFNGKLMGRRFRIPSFGGVRVEPAEPWMLPLLECLFELKSGTFVDAGVNLGQTLLMVAALDPQRAYIGFEPNPACADYVGRLISANQLNSCRLIPAGLSDQTGLVTLDLFHEDTDSAASIIAGFRPGQEIRTRKDVVVFNAADLTAELFAAPIGVVKIDVEGAEREVLLGLSPLLRRDRPLIVIEVLPPYTEENTLRLDRQRSIERLLQELDYRIFRLGHAPLVACAISEFGVHSDLQQCDYVLAPSELAREVQASLANPSDRAG